jgi:hypothetical protein
MRKKIEKSGIHTKLNQHKYGQKYPHSVQDSRTTTPWIPPQNGRKRVSGRAYE